MFSKLFDANRPFDISRWPYYYGWVILAVGTLGMVVAVPGSPPGMSVFVDDMLEALQIERATFALAYTLGTIFAGLCAPYAGSLVDRFGSRLTGCLSFFFLGIVLILTGLLDHIYRTLAPLFGGIPISALLVFCAFFGMRLLGLSFGITICRSMVFRWFEGRRGWASAVIGMVLSLSFSSAPILLNGIVLKIGWQDTWIALGLSFACGMTLIAYILFRDSPESCGVPVETTAKSEAMKTRIPVVRDFTAAEAVRTPTFWIIILGLSLTGLIGTGVSFHIIGLADAHGIARQEAVELFLPSAIFQIVTALALGALVERIQIKYILGLMILMQILTLLGALNLGDLGWRWGYIISNGVCWGAFGILMNVPWPRFYGRLNLGAINGWVSGATIVTSALGPYMFGLSFELYDGFQAAILACLILCPVALLLSFAVTNPQALGED